VLGDTTGNAYGQTGAGSPVAYINGFDVGTDILELWGNGGADAGQYGGAAVQVGATSVWQITDTTGGLVASIDVQSGNGLQIFSPGNVTWL
jgi:hypothetical protein